MRLFVEIAAHCLWQGNQKIVLDFYPVSLPSMDSVDESQLRCVTDIGVFRNLLQVAHIVILNSSRFCLSFRY